MREKGPYNISFGRTLKHAAAPYSSSNNNNNNSNNNNNNNNIIIIKTLFNVGPTNIQYR